MLARLLLVALVAVTHAQSLDGVCAADTAQACANAPEERCTSGSHGGIRIYDLCPTHCCAQNPGCSCAPPPTTSEPTPPPPPTTSEPTPPPPPTTSEPTAAAPTVPPPSNSNSGGDSSDGGTGGNNEISGGGQRACTAGKEVAGGRCRLTCPEGATRNADFRCKCDTEFRKLPFTGQARASARASGSVAGPPYPSPFLPLCV